MKRFSPDYDDMTADPKGVWVRFEDVSSMLAERDALLASLEATVPRGSTFTPPDQAGRLLRERNAALEALQRIADSESGTEYISLKKIASDALKKVRAP